MRRPIQRLLLLAGLFAAPAGLAADLYVRAGHLVDVERGVVLADQLISISGQRIEHVQPFTVPPGDAKLIDWSGYTVLPGLIDMHSHLVGDIQSANIAGPLLTSAADDVLTGAKNARDTLRAGFTTVRDVGTYRALADVSLRNAINAGLVEGPRMAVAGAYVTSDGGGGEVTGLAPDIVLPADMRAGVIHDEAEARRKTRYLLTHGADFIKLIATGAVLTVGTEPGQPELSEAEMKAVVEEAARLGKYAIAHAHGAEGIKMAVRAGVRSIEHGSLADDEALALMKKNGTWLVADIYNGDYIDEIGRRDGWPAETLRKNRETTQTQREAFRKAVRLGVNIAFGTDSGVYPHGLNARQFPYMVRYGMTPMQAIQSATSRAAQALRWEKDVGAISAGRYADMIAVAGDPLADISLLAQVKGVIKGGAIITSPR